MSQPETWNVPTTGPAAPLDYATRDSEAHNAHLSSHSGDTPPSYAVEGTPYLDTSAALRLLKMFDGTDWLTLLMLNAASNVAVPYMQHGPWIDFASASTVNLGAQASNAVRITGTTTVTSFGTAPAGVSKLVRAAAALPITYNATSMILLGGISNTMAAGDVSEFVSEGSGNWREVARHRVPLRFRGFEVITASDATWAPDDGTTAALFIGQGAGGGGHYANCDVSESAAGSGASAGATGFKWVGQLSGTYNISIGSAGLASNVGAGLAPTAGGATSISGTGISMTCSGGVIGGTTGTGTSLFVALGGAGPGVPSGSDFGKGGEPGGHALRLNAGQAIAGRGGSSPFGTAGREGGVNSTGATGNGYGFGGTGGAGSSNADRDGSNGGDGVVIVLKFGW